MNEITLTPFREYTLRPFGKFSIKDTKGKTPKRNNVLDFARLRFNSDNTMRLTPEEENLFINAMLESKTDIFSYGNLFYSRIGYGFGEVSHPNITKYIEKNNLQYSYHTSKWEVMK